MTTHLVNPRQNILFLLRLLESTLHTLDGSGLRDHDCEFLKNQLSNIMLNLNEGRLGYITWDRQNPTFLPSKSGSPNLKNRDGIVFDESFIKLANAFGHRSSSVQTNVFRYIPCADLFVKEALGVFGNCDTVCLSPKQIVSFTTRNQHMLSKMCNNYFVVCLPDKTKHLVTVHFIDGKFKIFSYKLTICRMKHLQSEGVGFFFRLD